jgi:hypothetical protein
MKASDLVPNKMYLAKIKWADGNSETCRVDIGAVDVASDTFSAFIFHKDGKLQYGNNGERFSAVQRIPAEWVIADWPTNENPQK